LGQNKKISEVKKKMEWEQFIDYMKEKPEALFNFMPVS
jgi:hypothetical protein